MNTASMCSILNSLSLPHKQCLIIMEKAEEIKEKDDKKCDFKAGIYY
jgi:hypothetical protein